MKSLIFVGLVAGGACAHAPSATVVHGTPPADLAFYVGSWACAGTSYDEKTGSVLENMPLRVQVDRDIDGWLAIHVYQAGKPVTSELKGYDAAAHVYHHLWTATDGTAGSLTSKGWAGNQLVFDEDHADPASKTRMTFTKLDDAHYTHRAEVDAGQGYKLSFTKTCTRSTS